MSILLSTDTVMQYNCVCLYICTRPWTALTLEVGVIVLGVMLPMILSVPEGHLCFLRCWPLPSGGAVGTAICGALSLSRAMWTPPHPTSGEYLGPRRGPMTDQGPVGPVFRICLHGSGMIIFFHADCRGGSSPRPTGSQETELSEAHPGIGPERPGLDPRPLVSCNVCAL